MIQIITTNFNYMQVVLSILGLVYKNNWEVFINITRQKLPALCAIDTNLDILFCWVLQRPVIRWGIIQPSGRTNWLRINTSYNKIMSWNWLEHIIHTIVYRVFDVQAEIAQRTAFAVIRNEVVFSRRWHESSFNNQLATNLVRVD